MKKQIEKDKKTILNISYISILIYIILSIINFKSFDYYNPLITIYIQLILGTSIYLYTNYLFKKI